MAPVHIFYKELPIDDDNIFTTNLSEKFEVQGILYKKYNEYAVIGLFINQDTDNLIKVTNRNRKKILQELIESLLKEEKKNKHGNSLKLHNSEGHEKVIPLTKKGSAELPSLKFKYLSLQAKKTTEVINFYDYYDHMEKFGFEWVDTSLTCKYTVELSSDKTNNLKNNSGKKHKTNFFS